MSQGSSGWVVLGGLFSPLLGPGLMLIDAVAIWLIGDGGSHGKGVAFWAIFAGVVGGRVLAFRGGNPQTSTGEPAEPHHLRPFVIRATAATVVVWAAAFLVGKRS